MRGRFLRCDRHGVRGSPPLGSPTRRPPRPPQPRSPAPWRGAMKSRSRFSKCRECYREQQQSAGIDDRSIVPTGISNDGSHLRRRTADRSGRSIDRSTEWASEGIVEQGGESSRKTANLRRDERWPRRRRVSRVFEIGLLSTRFLSPGRAPVVHRRRGVTRSVIMSSVHGGKKRCYHVSSGNDARDSGRFCGCRRDADVSLREKFLRGLANYYPGSLGSLDPPKGSLGARRRLSNIPTFLFCATISRTK